MFLMDVEQDRVRPGPLRWVWYALGGALPPRHNTWVLHDTTCRTWIPRYVARATVQISPLIVAVLVFIPAALSVRVLTAVGTGLPSILFALFFAVPGNENRLAKAGYPAGIGERIRTERSTRAQIEGNRLRRERMAARQVRRSLR
jgi:hypothetical protein